MKSIKGKEETLKNYLTNHQATVKERQNIRFLMEWTATVELEIESGKNANVVIPKLYNEFKERYENADINIIPILILLEETWIYGNELKKCHDNKKTRNKKNDDNLNNEEPQICITKHARKRLHTRCGLNKKAQDKAVKKALLNGITLKTASRNLKTYMLQVLDHTIERQNSDVRVLNDKIYLFKKLENCTLLITTMQIPNEILKLQTAI